MIIIQLQNKFTYEQSIRKRMQSNEYCWINSEQLGSRLQRHTTEYLPIPQLEGRTVRKMHAGYLQSYFLLDDGQIVYLGAPIDKSYTSKVLSYHKRFSRLLELWQKYTKKIFSKRTSLTDCTNEPTLLNGSRIHSQYKILDFNVGDCTLFYNYNSTVYAMGDNTDGQLGIKDAKYVGEFEKVRFSQHQPIRKLSAGLNHTVFVSSYGNVFGCGKGFNQASTITTADNIVQEVSIETELIDSSHKIVLPSAGENHTIFLSKDNKLYGYGDNKFGQSGHDPVTTPTLNQLSEIPCYFGKYQPILDIQSGLNHSLIMTDKRVYFLGSNHNNQYPFKKQGSKDSIWSPLIVPVEGVPAKIFAKFNRSAILTKNGVLYVFGGNAVEGQSGDVQTVRDQFINPNSEVGLGYAHTLISV